MVSTSRFECASSTLALKDLARKSRRVSWLCLGLGTAVHLCLTEITGLEAKRKVSKPLTTHFIKRQPRLTKPLELKKRPAPKRRQIRRRMVAVKARTRRDSRTVAFRPAQMLRGMARPAVAVGRVAYSASVGMGSRTIAAAIKGAKEVEHKVDMALEMLDVQALDTGRYHAMVVVDPTDKRGIKGFLHIAMAGSHNPMQYHDARWRRGVQNLAAFMSEHTGIRADLSQFLYLDSLELFKTPWIYCVYLVAFDVTDSELANLGRYMLSGGFFWGDNDGQGENLGAYISMDRTIIKSLETQGFLYEKHWTYERLPHSHAILHCYFDLDSAPMGGGASCKMLRMDLGWDMSPYLDAVVRDGAVISLKTDQMYTHAWADWGPGGFTGGYESFDPTRCFQLGVNTIIFALTQEGSITHRLLDTIQY